MPDAAQYKGKPLREVLVAGLPQFMPGCGVDQGGNFESRRGPMPGHGKTHLFVEAEAVWFYIHVPSMSAVPYRLRKAYLQGMLKRGQRPPEWPEPGT